MRTGLIALVWLLLFPPLQAQQPSYQSTVVTDRTDAIYEVGESAKFQVTLTKGDQPVNDATVTYYVVDDFITDQSVDTGYPRGGLQTDGNSAIEVRMLSPGFLRCEVTFVSPENEKLEATAGAGFSPTKIEPSLPVPDDFDEFWTKQKALLAEVPVGTLGVGTLGTHYDGIGHSKNRGFGKRLPVTSVNRGSTGKTRGALSTCSGHDRREKLAFALTRRSDTLE